jgi:hypothetical protein
MEESDRSDTYKGPPFGGLLPSFVVAFIAAPLAGTLAASAVSMPLAAILVALSAIWPDTPWRQDLHYQGLWDTTGSIVGVGLMTAFASFVLSATYVAVMGGAAVIRYRKTGKTPSRAAALAWGLLTGIVPCGGFAVFVGNASEFARPGAPGNAAVVVFLLVVIITATLATVWTFWHCAFAGRPEGVTSRAAAPDNRD